MNEISLQRLHTVNLKRNSKFLLSLTSSELSAFQARAKSRKENGKLEEAVDDLTEALKLNPNNRDIRKMLIKVKEDIVSKTNPNQKEAHQNNNNNNNVEMPETRLALNNDLVPIGSTISKNLKYVDDTASQKSEVSSVAYQSNNR